MKPKDAIKLDIVPLDKTYLQETILPEDGFYRYLYQPVEQHGGQKRRATDLIWSKNTYRLYRIIQDPGYHVLYYLQDGPDRAVDDDEFDHIVKNSQRVPRFNDQYENHSCVEEFIKECNVMFVYGTYVSEAEVDGKFSLCDIWNFFQGDALPNNASIFAGK